MRNTGFIAAALFLLIFAGYANEERPPESAPGSGALSRAAAHPLIHEGLLTNPTEGLVIGNGDLAASVQIFSNELKLNLGKNDVWDTRYRSPSKTVPGLTRQSPGVVRRPCLIDPSESNSLSATHPEELK